MSEERKRVVLEVAESDGDMRVDAFVARVLHWRSRASVAALCAEGAVRVGGRAVKKSARLTVGTHVEVSVPVDLASLAELESIELSVLYEDDDLVVVDKPAGLPVHPASTCQDVNVLRRLELRYAKERVDKAAVPSIVHRLDRHTTGVVAFAKRRELVAFYTGQFEHRTVSKMYRALVHGTPPPKGAFDDALVVVDERPVQVGAAGKRSKTDFQRIESANGLSMMDVRPLTGRKHQIRVHFAAGGFPLVFDDLYGRVEERAAWPAQARVMLHAAVLELDHRDGRRLRFEAEVPADMEAAFQVGYDLGPTTS